MNVTELISLLKEIPGHLNVFSKSEDGRVPINTIKIEESIIPQGIKYLLLNELNEPLKEPLKENSKEEPDEVQKTHELVADKPKRIRGKKPKMNEEETQKIINHVKEGRLNYSRIAERIGCSVSHVSRTAKKQGLRKKKKITIGEAIIINQPEPIQVDFTTEKTKGRRSGMQKDFDTYNIRCRKCGLGKPKKDYKGTWRICKSCRTRKKKDNKDLIKENDEK